MSFYGQKYIQHYFQDNENETLKDLARGKNLNYLIINWIFSTQKKGFHLDAILNELWVVTLDVQPHQTGNV